MEFNSLSTTYRSHGSQNPLEGPGIACEIQTKASIKNNPAKSDSSSFIIIHYQYLTCKYHYLHIIYCLILKGKS